MGFFLFFAGVVVLTSMYWYDAHSKNSLFVEYGYYYELARNVIYYIFEIVTLFGLFLMLIKNPFYVLNYASEDNSYFKQFIDFYTFYQILIIVILRLMNSKYVEELKKLLDLVGMERVNVEEGKPGFSLVDIEMFSKVKRPKEIEVIYEEMKRRMENCLKVVEGGGNMETEKNKLLIYLEREQILINMLINNKENEWRMSLIITYLAYKNKLTSS